MRSTNQLLVCEPYIGSTGLKSKISSGVAIIQQKTTLIGLKVMMDFKISKHESLKKGDTVYIKEEIMMQFKDQYSRKLDCKDVDGEFILVNFAHVAFIKESNEDI